VIRVLHVSRNFHPHAGGTEEFIASLARHTRGLGIESSVLCTDRHPDGTAPPPEIPVLRVPTVGTDRLQLTRHVTPRVRERLQAADVLHFHDLRFGLDLARRGRVRPTVPRVLSTHGLIFHTAEHAALKRLAWRAAYLPTLRRLDLVLADSAHDYEAVATLPRARMVENPVDVDDFLTIAALPPRPAGPIVSFGRIAPNKGLERLAPVLRCDPALRLVVVGTGDARAVEDLRRAFDGLDVDLAGPLPRARLVERLRDCSGVVLPSRTEGFGITLVEAMATGRPVIAADIPPYRAIAGDTDVSLVDCDDPAAIRDAIGATRASVDRSRSVARARSFSWDARAHEFVEIYRKLVDEAPADA
jgi:alpha-1,3-mannosyltransferase